MANYTTAEARTRFSEVINEAAYGAKRVVLTRHGKNIAAVIPISDLELLHELERILDVNEARDALEEARARGSVTLEALKRELGLTKGGPRNGRALRDTDRAGGKTTNKKVAGGVAKKGR